MKRLVEGYASRGVKTLICSCPCCVNIMSRDWPVFYGKELPFKIRHITQFVADAFRQGKLRVPRELRESVIYHDPCYLSRGVGVIEEPREVLRSIPGLTVLEFEQHGLNSRCCGSGGAARKVFHDNAIAMGRLTIDEAVAKKADRLILSCPACYAKVNEAMQGYEKQIRITDIMELLASVLVEEPWKQNSPFPCGLRGPVAADLHRIHSAHPLETSPPRHPLRPVSAPGSRFRWSGLLESAGFSVFLDVEFHGPEHQPVDGHIVVGRDADQLVDDRGVDAGGAAVDAAADGSGDGIGGLAAVRLPEPRRSSEAASKPVRFACSARRIPMRLATSPC